MRNADSLHCIMQRLQSSVQRAPLQPNDWQHAQADGSDSAAGAAPLEAVPREPAVVSLLSDSEDGGESDRDAAFDDKENSAPAQTTTTSRSNVPRGHAAAKVRTLTCSNV
jgi:hypothetical protein